MLAGRRFCPYLVDGRRVGGHGKAAGQQIIAGVAVRYLVQLIFLADGLYVLFEHYLHGADLPVCIAGPAPPLLTAEKTRAGYFCNRNNYTNFVRERQAVCPENTSGARRNRAPGIPFCIQLFFCFSVRWLSG